MSENLATFEDNLADQLKIIAAIDRLVPNFKKSGKANMTRGATRSRVDTLKNYWASCQELDRKLSHEASEEDKANPYFTEDQFAKAELGYLDTLGFLYEWLFTFDTPEPAATSSFNVSHPEASSYSAVRLPRIDIPKFTGNKLEWENFRDMFESLINSNKTLSKVQRFHYLKASLEGEASQILKSVLVTDANYDAAWATLQERYDNKRGLIMVHLEALLNVPAASSGSAVDLQRLRDGTNEALTALLNLNRPVKDWDDLIVYITLQKLDVLSRQEWELSLGPRTDFPAFSELDSFLKTRALALGALKTPPVYQILSADSVISTPSSSGINSKSPKSPNVKSHHLASTTSPCSVCKRKHAMAYCPTFRRKPLSERLEIAQTQRCCFNCLKTGHWAPDCPSEARCRHCQRKHHSLLHSTPPKDAPRPAAAKPDAATYADKVNTSATSSEPQIPEVNHHLTQSKLSEPRVVLLATARVQLRVSNGRTIQVRALLDQGSESTFITESVAQMLQAPRQKVHVTVSGLGGKTTNVIRSVASLQLEPCNQSTPALDFNAYVLQRLTSYLPKPVVTSELLSQFEGITLADPDLEDVGKIDVLIGADLYATILLDGLRKTHTGGPIAQNTIFGWVISGFVPSARSLPTISVHHCAQLEELDTTLKKFWELEEISPKRPLSLDDERCEQQFLSTHRREKDGRYTVRLPLKQDRPLNIGESRFTAVALLHKLETRLARNDDHCTLYHNFMDEYQSLGHMEPVSRDSTDQPSEAVYLPHHAVFRDSSSTSRLRVVFNASSNTSNGKSLNDNMLVGPKLQSDLTNVILRWRKHPVAFIADIEKMYRQIWVHPDDVDLQRIVWRVNPTEEVQSYRLLTVTYGTTSAPYLALRVIQQLAHDEQEKYPIASTVLRNDCYVDDVLSGASTVTEAKILRTQLTGITKSGGFNLRKWASSHPEILEDVPADHRASAKVHDLQEDESLKVLGLEWDPARDAFKFNVQLPIHQSVHTKRSILSMASKLFDPMGWLTPVVVKAKIIIQELWLRKIDWDEPVPDDIQMQWIEYCRTLPNLQDNIIPRFLGLYNEQLAVELHGFADASTRAYAAVVYLRVLHNLDNVRITLLVAKSKVAPVRQISIPRLELCAAQLLARLIERVQRVMDLGPVPVHAWTDSAVVIAWLKDHSSRWCTFVANRVADVQTRVPNTTWRHVPSHENPADCASRGIMAEELSSHPLWWQGPPWLSSPSTRWPLTQGIIHPDTDTEERRYPHTHLARNVHPEWELLSKFSSWTKLLRVTAYCRRFGHNARRPANQRNLDLLTAEEVRSARNYWLRQAQTESFSHEIDALQNKQPLARNSPLLKLNPFVDGEGLVRVGGRLCNSPLANEERHPFILPRHRVSDLLVDHAHRSVLHGGPQLTIRILRQHYWILGCRQLVRSKIHRCVKCLRERAKGCTQLMGNLPQSRTSPARPFLHTGVDYAGPIFVRLSKGRGHKTQKAYVAVFVCFVVRAIHLELVSDYSASGFLAAFQRFVSRRGVPSDLYSDNGTTFRGADTELQQAFNTVTRDRDLAALLASDGTTWHFMPPSAPHFGGLWEAGVKSFKHHLRRVVGTHTLTFEELSTFLTRVEACLNSRPLGPLNDDPSDITALTPGHFLIGAPLKAIPEPSVLDLRENRLSRWQLIQQMTEHLWKRWSAEYLHSLQQRSKWRNQEPPLELNELVLVCNDLLPPTKWPLGRIVALHPGPDGHTRVVTIRTAGSTLKRPISKICPLLIRGPEDEPPPTNDGPAPE